MAGSSREAGNSGPFSSQLPDGMCFGSVCFIQSCPSVFFSPVQLVGKVYPSLQTAGVFFCLRRKARIEGAFPVTFASLWICRGLRTILLCTMVVLNLPTDSLLMAQPTRASL